MMLTVLLVYDIQSFPSEFSNGGELRGTFPNGLDITHRLKWIWRKGTPWQNTREVYPVPSGIFLRDEINDPKERERA